MTASLVSVVIPVKNGARWLPETFDALSRDPAIEVLVIDSGSTDGSVAMARERGMRVLQIAPEIFGHGRTRNLGLRDTAGELVCFLTQDATPQRRWADAYREVMAEEEEVGAAFGPHVPRPGSQPMIARELEDVFARFAADDGGRRVWPRGEAPFLSNVNACYRRKCLEQLGGFPDVAYAEDQAFARILAGSEWRLAYHPAAAVLHAHSYGLLTFMRRYFDEYRGLRATTGHVAGFGLRSTARVVRDEVVADRGWMREHRVLWPARAAWTARAELHPGGRRSAAALGSRAERLPGRVADALSLEATRRTARNAPRIEPAGSLPWNSVLQIARDGPTPLLPPVPGLAERDELHVAVVIPHFRRGSGGHAAIFELVARLEERGHTVTIWLHDPLGVMGFAGAAVLREKLHEFFRPSAGPVFKGFADWFGCDVALATGWETAYAVLGLDHCRARAYLVQDYEPEFFASSAQRLWAEQTYCADLHPIAASSWLAEVVEARTGFPASRFDHGVDHDVYRPLDLERRDDTVIFYCRDVTPRRGVPLGLLALAELHRRRPRTRFVLFGDQEPPKTPFAYEHLGIATPVQLAHAYATATVGLSLSLTNCSLVPQEMLACGLPCVEIAGRSFEARYGDDGPLLLVPPDPVVLADALEHLLDNPAERERRAHACIGFVSERTWDRAAAQVEAALRTALRLREDAGGSAALASARP